MAGIACQHYNSTWSSLRNIEERCLTETPSSGSKPFSRGSAATSRLNWLKSTAQPNTYTCSSTTRQSTQCRAWSTASKVFPVAYSVANARIWRNAIGTTSCGRLPTSPPVVAGHRWAFLSNTSSNKRPHSNGPYIPGLKVRGFMARSVRPCSKRSWRGADSTELQSFTHGHTLGGVTPTPSA